VIVLDASALVELLIGIAAGRIVAARISDPAIGLHAPHLADVDVAQALRRLVRDRELDALDAEADWTIFAGWTCSGIRTSHCSRASGGCVPT
jgi:predicted nucleic acid-binding protein